MKKREDNNDINSLLDKFNSALSKNNEEAVLPPDNEDRDHSSIQKQTNTQILLQSDIDKQLAVLRQTEYIQSSEEIETYRNIERTEREKEIELQESLRHLGETGVSPLDSSAGDGPCLGRAEMYSIETSFSAFLLQRSFQPAFMNSSPLEEWNNWKSIQSWDCLNNLEALRSQIDAIVASGSKQSDLKKRLYIAITGHQYPKMRNQTGVSEALKFYLFRVCLMVTQLSKDSSFNLWEEYRGIIYHMNQDELNFADGVFLSMERIGPLVEPINASPSGRAIYWKQVLLRQ